MRNNSESGLTLIEIILSLTISAVLFAILLGAMRLGHDSVRSGRERAELSQRMRVLSDRLSWLIRGTYPYVIYDPEQEDKKVLYFSGTPQSAGFVTTSVDEYSDSMEDRPALKWVTISVDAEGLKVQESLFYSEVFEEEPTTEFVLDTTVTAMELEYLDGGEKGNEALWVSEWNPEEADYLPSAVRLTLVLLYKGGEVVMPSLIVPIRTGRTLSLEIKKTKS